MRILEMPVRYRRMMKVSDPNRESNFHTAEKTLALPVEQTGFVLVDLWDCSRMPDEIKPGGISFCARAGDITETRIKPALEAARALGMTVIHVPTAYVAEKYEERYRRAAELEVEPSPAADVRDWPPAEARQAWTQETWEARYGDYGPEENRLRMDNTFIPEAAEPVEGEWLIGTSEQMHAICRREGLLNLVYVGFATNMCLLFKPGALWEMSRAGYRCVVLRDCTTAVENAETYAGLDMTRVFVDWFEMYMLAYTALSEDFLRACEAARHRY